VGTVKNAEAKDALTALHRETMDLNPSVARSLGKGLEETLTVHRLHVSPRLRHFVARGDQVSCPPVQAVNQSQAARLQDSLSNQ
jgi:hypothetical protein